MLPLLAALASASLVVTYSLADTTVTSTSPDGEQTDAFLRFNVDGSATLRVDLSIGGTSDSTAFNWSSVAPDESEAANWSVRLASLDTGGTLYTGTPALGTWVLISTVPVFDWFLGAQGGPVASGQSTYTFELSNDGGTTVHSSMTATVNLDIASP